MSYPLARMIKRAGKTRRKSLTLRAINPTSSQALELAAIINQVVSAWSAAGRGRIMAAYDRTMAERTMDGRRATMDASIHDTVDDIQAEIDAAEAEIERLVLLLTPKLRDWTIRIERWHRQRFIASVLTPTGVDLSTLLNPEGEIMDAFRQGILALIRNIDEDTRGRIAGAVWRGFQERTPRREVAREIAKAVQISRRRALFIASDQTVKMAARLDQARQEEAGISEYEWMKSGKLHPRQAHVIRDGLIYQWKKPPLGGHPGTEPNCGCKARAYLRLD